MSYSYNKPIQRWNVLQCLSFRNFSTWNVLSRSLENPTYTKPYIAKGVLNLSVSVLMRKNFLTCIGLLNFIKTHTRIYNIFFLMHYYVNVFCPSEIEIKYPTDPSSAASHQPYLQLHAYDKRDDFNFSTVSFPFLDSNFICFCWLYGVFVFTVNALW